MYIIRSVCFKAVTSFPLTCGRILPSTSAWRNKERTYLSIWSKNQGSSTVLSVALMS